MCFIIKKERAKIAKGDIECWKVINDDNTPFFSCVHNNYIPYVKNELCTKVKIKIDEDYIDKGYHSFILPTTATELIADLKIALSCKHLLAKTCKFIIPKGTRYFENDAEYVSETIKLID